VGAGQAGVCELCWILSLLTVSTMNFTLHPLPRLLLAAKVVQTMADAEALVFLDRNFEEMFNV
jgi:hypothetical protein